MDVHRWEFLASFTLTSVFSFGTSASCCAYVACRLSGLMLSLARTGIKRMVTSASCCTYVACRLRGLMLSLARTGIKRMVNTFVFRQDSMVHLL
uniref:Uncharacterized protein n=1 Tax=Rhipicephalus microplus TaxID=6941 RepID=A0A6M2DDF2_RHIMP